MKHSRQTLIFWCSIWWALCCLLPGVSAAGPDAGNDDDALKKLTELRRRLHRIPERGNLEFKTRRLILNHLESINKNGQLIIKPVLKTGVLAILKGDTPGSIMFRADIDALPITENTGVSFASRHQGMMHACGHDAHTAIVLRLAAEAVKHKRHRHTVLFLFQPAEEVKGGADEIVGRNILEPYHIKAAFALHIHPGAPTGEIGYTPGIKYSGSFYYSFTVAGPGGHMADADADRANPILRLPDILDYFYRKLPNLGSDPSRTKVGVTKIHGGEKSNILPAKLVIGGSVRTLDPGISGKLEPEIERALAALVEGTPFHLEDMTVRRGTPMLRNHPPLVRRCVKSLQAALPGVTFVEQKPAFFSDDFAYYTTLYPSFYFSLGCQYSQDRPTSLHTAGLRIDERAMVIGLKIFLQLLAGSY